ncbi:MAG TPA: Flp pilus assembly protein CpaB [Polyangia bacterium]
MAIDDIITAGQKNRRDGGGSRRSASRAILFWTMALIAGASAAMMFKWYLDKSQASAVGLSKVVVATMDLPVATALKPEHMTLVDWPAKVRPQGASGKIEDLVGRVLIAKTLKAEPILPARLASKEAGSGLAALIPENMRAVAVRVDDVVGVAGFVHPEDRVDVIATIRPDDGETTSKVILQNIKVLAVGRQMDSDDKKKAKALPVTVATLLVTPAESERLALAAIQGKILLTLRSGSDNAEVLTNGVAPVNLLKEGVPPTTVVAEAPKPRVIERRRPVVRDDKGAPAPTVPSAHVEILRGDRFEERKFEAKEKP